MADPITYWPAPDAMKIAASLIAVHHPHLIDFAYRIVMRSKSRPAGHGKIARGTAEIIRGRFAFFVMTEEEVEQQSQSLSNPYQMFWMELSAEEWDQLDDNQKVALVDHELCHFGVDFPEEADEPKLVLIPHDAEEFTNIVRRHGLWTEDLVKFGAAALGFEGV